MKKILFITLLNLGLLLPVKSESMLATIASYLTYKTAILAGSAIAATLGVKWFRTPNKALPKLEDLNVQTFVPNNNATSKNTVLDTAEQVKNHFKSGSTQTVNVAIEKDKNYLLESGFPATLKDAPVVCIALGGSLNNWSILSGGKNCNPGGYAGYRVIKGNIIDGMPCVTFDCVTEKRASFNFCQEQDLHALDLVIKKIIALNKDVKIVMHGTCKGGSLALRYLAEKAEQKNTSELNAIKGLVIEGPPNSVKDAIKNQPGYPISLGMAKACMPNLDTNAKTILHAKKFPNTPIFLGAITTDSVSPYDDVQTMKKHLDSLRAKPIELYTSKEKLSHSEMTKKDKEFQTLAQAFFKQALSVDGKDSQEKKEKSESR